MPHVIIIGASRGIGLELVRQYSTDGWSVLATVRAEGDRAALDALPGVTTAIADTTDEASLTTVAAAVAEPVDTLIVNAGKGSRERSLAVLDAAEWRQVMEVNALGPLLALRTLAAKVRDGGQIVALSSRMGSIGENSGGAYSYRMSKAALNMGLSCAAAEYGGRVAVAALHPGWVKTDMGGASAPVEVTDSAAGLRRVIAALVPGKAAVFLDYTGDPIGW